MFGNGQCGTTALALMRMIPQPFEYSKPFEYSNSPWKSSVKNDDNMVNSFMAFLNDYDRKGQQKKFRRKESKLSRKEVENYDSEEEDECFD